MGPVFSDYFQEELKKRFQWDETKVEEEKGGFVFLFIYTIVKYYQITIIDKNKRK